MTDIHENPTNIDSWLSHIDTQRFLDELSYRPMTFHGHKQRYHRGTINGNLQTKRKEVNLKVIHDPKHVCDVDKAKKRLMNPPDFKHFGDGHVDRNGNASLLNNRECPICKNSSSILWKNVTASVLVGDAGPGTIYLENNPDEESIMFCSLCSYEGPFSEWGPHTDLSDPETPSCFKPGDVILSTIRRKGTDRDRIFDLYKFVAKTGTDKVVRWCRDRHPVHENIRHTNSGRQLARLMDLPYTSVPIKHREPVPTRQSIAQDALSTL